MADPIRRLVQHLSRLPGIGEKTATRLAYHLVRTPPGQIRELAQALLELIEKTRFCSLCMNVTEHDPCEYCRDDRRDSAIICVVSSPSDVAALERGRAFQGRYHVLHGLLSPLDGIGPEDLRIRELLTRLETSGNQDNGPGEDGIVPRSRITEVIIATAASVEGEATAMYLAHLIKPLHIRVSRIASGIPVGGELEYTDQATIVRAIEGRLEL